VTGGKAQEKWTRFFGHHIWHQLSELECDGSNCTIIQENPSKNFYHPCSPEDYRALLSELPQELTSGLKAIILRRPPASDQRLGIEARRRFSCVIINAFPTSNQMVWNIAPTDRDIRHYKPWCSSWVQSEGKWVLQWSDSEIRRYYLFHLFLHELGHINQPMFHALKRREDFAESFALQHAAHMGVL